jgi:DNA-binding NarL/FixJ family response regulator
MSQAVEAPGVMMVDDNSLAAAAMERRFGGSSELRWLGWTSDPREAVTLITERRPAVALLDVEMPGVDTIMLLRQIVQALPGIAVVMFSGHDQPTVVDRALAEGAAGYIHKDEPTALIAGLVLRAARGECVLSPLVSRVYMRSAGSAAVVEQ